MKPMSGSGGSNNWLGFSLSSQMKMEVSCAEPQDHHHQGHQSHHHGHHHHHHHQPQHTTPAPPTAAVSNGMPGSFFLSPSHLNNSGMCYGVDGVTGGIYSELSVMPLKSDGSLCIMEALNRSQQQGLVPSPSPKLEDFLGGGPNIGTHHQFGNTEREAMALSLDSMYYHHHNQEPKGNREQNHSLEFLQQPFRQQSSYFQPLQEGICTALTGHDMYPAPLEEEHMGDHGFPSLKNWVARNYNGGINVMGGNEAGMGSGSVAAIGYGDLHSLSLSMSPGSQSSCVTAPQHISCVGASDCMALDVSKKRMAGKGVQKQPVHRKSIDTFGQRTSQYRGVTRHRWTGRYEAHLWDNSCKKEGQTRKGRQVYLGGYDMEEKAARAYDLAALKYWGPSTHINFPLENYQEELEEMMNMTRQEYVAHLRRKSSGFSRGASMYRGVTRHHQHGRWQARIGRVAGNKDLYLGTFSTQEEAAEAYDIAAIKFRGANAVTNFDITRYDVDKIIASNTLLSGELARKNKAAIGRNSDLPLIQNVSRDLDLTEDNSSSGSDWKMVLYQSPQHNVSVSESLNERPMLHGLFGMETVSLIHGMDDSGKPGNLHLSNHSSLVTSLSSSREGSPDRAGLSKIYSKAPAKLISTPWPAIPMSGLPVFSGWSDA
ncbi:AP2-like ethylene-responsive transcription factor ANT [Phalaenopsis equestris]|uniref:AP2-like ethylene-responsive transcription factor ANT n=1 Tax=Phalaenopsis equestris TaxID=78828 RepID=UPI0009E532B7|nr:AP2-like ethylene-responsive transcription factor ANT [Phalaenopsis equestris]